MPYVKVNDIQMYYEIHGDGEPLVLIVGLGTDISEWEGIIRWLAQNYKVLAFDNRGAGRTDKPDTQYSIDKYYLIDVKLGGPFPCLLLCFFFQR
jgi:3-oxoadipate enol-lactonase